MIWRWITTRYVDPSLPLSARQARELILAARQRKTGHLALAPLLVLLYIAGALIFLFCVIFLSRNPGTLLAWTGAGILVTAGVITVWMHSGLGPSVRRLLRTKGFDVCVSCGYWRRDLETEGQRCPECGVPPAKITL